MRLTLYLGICAVCWTPIRLPAEGHHQSGIVGQAIILSHLIPASCPFLPCPGPLQPPFNVPDQPFQTHVRIYSEKGVLVSDALTDANGQFSLPLKPGTYTVLPYPMLTFSDHVLVPVVATVTVSKKEWVSVLASYAYSSL
jgi:hypothetical protein